MVKSKMWSRVRVLMLLVAVGLTAEFVGSDDAQARAGRGRSIGRSSGFGSRSMPPPSQPHNRFDSPSAAPMQPPVMNRDRGGFMRGLAGGLAGGFLGSMLFSSLGHAAGGFGGPGRGGVGLFEIILIAGVAYLAFRWWKQRQQRGLAFANANRSGFGNVGGGFRSDARGQAEDFLAGGQFPALAAVAVDTEEASDVFFKIQGAWTRRDVASVRDLVDEGMLTALSDDLDELKRQRQINRLENISVRRVEVVESWQEGGTSFSTVRFSANLLDYTVDETSGRIVHGSDAEPVKFEERWTFSKVPTAAKWRLVGIEQN